MSGPKKEPAEPAPGDGAERTSPPAAGVDPSVGLLGPEEIRDVFARAAERDDLRVRLLRAQADLDNFRRRESQERRRAAEEEADRALGPVLDALDSFTRAVESAERTRDVAALVEGVNLAFRELERRLAEGGVTRVEGVGQAMNPELHRAVAQEPTGDHPPLTVLQVFAHGWRRGDRVLRPAQVKVAAPPAAADAPAAGEEA
jgi:molecular chaperone GrpE